jgi:ATP-binding protein involved in chromosome partitioning
MIPNQPIEKQKLTNIKHIIIVASGKGGVGKSTIAAGIAMSLAAEGYATGLLDADIYGPSVPTLFGLTDKNPMVEMREGKQYMVPFERFGIKLMSIGFFIDNRQAVVWRGPRASSGVSQLLTETWWGDLDYLIMIHLPEQAIFI